MSGVGIRVTPEQLAALSMQVGRGSSQIDGELSSLSGAISPLVGGEWAGTAAAQFTALWEEWQRSAVALRTALEGIGSLLARAGQSYAAAEQQIAASFRI